MQPINLKLQVPRLANKKIFQKMEKALLYAALFSNNRIKIVFIFQSA